MRTRAFHVGRWLIGVVLGLAWMAGMPATAAPVNPGQPTYFWQFNEGSGALAGSAVGNQDGRLNDNAFYTNDTPFGGGYAVALDGVDDAVYFGGHSGFEFVNTQFTGCVWVKAPDINARRAFFSKLSNEGPYGYMAAMADNYRAEGMIVDTNGSDIHFEWGTPVTQPDDDTWHHVAYIFDTVGGGSARIFVDGVEATLVTPSWGNGLTDYDGAPGVNLVLGARSKGVGGGAPPDVEMQGIFDDFVVYDRALTPDEIEWLANNEVEFTPTVPGEPDYLWLFDEGAGTTAYGKFGGVNGTLKYDAFYTNDTPFGGGYAMALDGVDDNVDFTAHAGFEFVNTQFTSCVWVKAPDIDARRAFFSKISNEGPYGYMAAMVDDTSIEGIIIDTNGVNYLFEYGTPGTQPDDGTWHHVAHILDTVGGGNVRIVVDGVEATLSIPGGADTLTDYDGAPGVSLVLGARSRGVGGGAAPDVEMQGIFDEFAIWNRVLTLQELRYTYRNSLKPPPRGTMLMLK